MISTAFMFTTKELDDEFRRLDGLILQAAEETQGYMGKKNWVSDCGTERNSVYYWASELGLKSFSRHPLHLEAKRQYERWYGGFHIEVSEVKKSYGDGVLKTITGNQRAQKSRA